ncbi:MAG: TatD family hydrolase [Patescibacteria group bacterium]
MWVDTHCHPYFKPFNEDREAALQRALDVGVSKMLVVGCDQETNRKTLELAKQHDFMWSALGVHPTDCNDLTDEELVWMRESTKEPQNKVVALGEMGLDYHHMKSTKEVQAEAFRKQIRLAKELDLYSVVHSRNAAEDTLKILLEEEARKVIFHCYSYDYEFGKKVWNQGFLTSFSGVVTYPTAKEVQEAAQHGPLDQFLLETDAPFLPPQSMRGKRNEMDMIPEICAKIAELRGIEIEEVARVTTLGAGQILLP